MLKDVLADKTVDSFLDHINLVKNHYGLDAFLNYIDSSVPARIQGRLYYKVELNQPGTTPLKVEFKDSEFSLPLREKYDELTRQGKEFDDYYEAVLERFQTNERFKDLVKEFEVIHPGKGEALGRFIAAQAGYVVIENIERRKLDERENTAVSDYKSTERNIKANAKKISALESDSKMKRSPELKALKQIHTNMEQRMPSLTSEYSKQGRTVNLTLDKARKTIAPFVKEKTVSKRDRPK